MFPAVCHQFANAMGRHTLIPSSSIDESTKIIPFNVVVKKIKRKWIFFHKVKHTVYDFPLNDLLQDSTVLETKLEENKFCSYNPESTYSLSGKFGVEIRKDLMDASLSASDKVTLSAKLGEVDLCEVADQNSFMAELMERKLNMDHPLIRQIRGDNRSILCVIRGVISTSDRAEIKRTDNKSEEVHIGEKVTEESGSINEDGSENKTKDIVLEKGTALAYKVWELKVDTNQGTIVPMMTAGSTGGFTRSSMDAPGGDSTEDDNMSVLEQCKRQLQPVMELTETDKQQLQSSLVKLMMCHSDVIQLSKLIEDAEIGELKQDREAVDNLLVNNEALWAVLSTCGVNTKDKTVTLDGEVSPLLTAVGHVVDAMTELDSQDLEKINQCSEEQRTALSKILKSSITSKMPVTIETDAMPALEYPADTLLTTLDFTICKDKKTILPPKLSTKDVECLYCIVSCLC